MDKKTIIAQTVLTELDQFNDFSVGEYKAPLITPLATKQTYEVYENQKQISKEPFISYVKVLEVLENGEEKERILLVCRNYTPLGVDPVNKFGLFINRNAPLGTLASKDVGDEVKVSYLYYGDRIKRTFFILEKSIFTPLKNINWDAINNNFFYGYEEEYIPSLRDLLFLESVPDSIPSSVIDSTESNIGLDETDLSGLDLIKELDEAELLAYQKKKEIILKKQKRNKAIVDSIALKDQPILDKSQDEYCRLPLASQILLVGSPGTGKTTTLIKRLAFKSDPEHLKSSDEIELENHKLKNWLMFTPNELLKIYLKEAMNKEGLLATDDKVFTWEKERTNLGRDVLKFLKTAKSGVFSRSSSETLSDNRSVSLTKYTNGFIEYFNNTILKDFSDAVSELEKNRSYFDETSKEFGFYARKFGRFTDSCKRISGLSETRNVSDPESKIVFLISDFQPLKTQLTSLRGEVADYIKQTLDDFIVANPQIIDHVAKIITENKSLSEQTVDLDSPEPLSELDEEVSELDDEINAEEESDLRVEARKQIRQVLVRVAESLAQNRPLKNKRQLSIWDLMASYFKDESLLVFIGRINIALRQRIFGQLDYDRVFKQFPIIYEKYRSILITNGSSDIFSDNGVENIQNKKISLNETDLLIYAMLRFAARIFERKKDFLRKLTNFDILENIKSQYRTQIAVDEAADFSAVQLGCMFHLADPEFKSVSFAGDLMQRVTHSGLTDWEECEFVSENLKKQELIISYRQTPVLLHIAGKLYENVIGEKPPFHSKNVDNNQDPRPLRFKASDDEHLGDWITERIHEIYEINDSKLPSIAIFVPEEDDIEHAYQIIQEKLNEISIDVEKCKEGKVLGTGSKIRIFSVEFIKGLEFEGVFFLGIDKIHNKKPDLLDKYLYVGLTRATTFLGVTYNTQFPEKIQFVENNFDEGNWSEFIN